LKGELSFALLLLCSDCKSKNLTWWPVLLLLACCSKKVSLVESRGARSLWEESVRGNGQLLMEWFPQDVNTYQVSIKQL
jgi:hypothetical protein